MTFPNGSNDPTSRHFDHGHTVPPKKKYEIDVEVDLPDKVVLELALMAHNRNMTLNDLCIEILENHLKGVNVSPEECPHNEAEPCSDGSFACTDCGKHVEIL